MSTTRRASRLEKILAAGAVAICIGWGIAASAAETETAGNNLSVPLVFAEGIGLSGGDVAEAPENTGLRGLPGEERFDGEFWYWWPDGASGEACEPIDPACPPIPEPADLEMVFVQKDEDNEWQADWVDGRTLEMSPVDVDVIDWGDNIESRVWTTTSMVRVEVALSKDIPLTGYEMRFLSGQGTSEVWGTNTVLVDAEQATVFSPCARLGIQKLEPGAGSLTEPPPPERLHWVPAVAEWAWNGPVRTATVYNSAVWERFGVDGPTDAYSAEVNVSGKTIFGHLWQLRRQSLPPGFNRAGWYRLTFSLDGTTDELECADFELNTSVRKAEIFAPVEETPEEPMVEEDGGGEDGDGQEPDRPHFTPVVDAKNNLTYVDVYVTEQGGSSSGSEAIRRRGKGRVPGGR